MRSHFKAIGKRGRLLVGVVVPKSFFKKESEPKQSSGGCTGETVTPQSAPQRQSSCEVLPRLEIRLGQGRASGRLVSFHPKPPPPKTKNSARPHASFFLL